MDPSVDPDSCLIKPEENCIIYHLTDQLVTSLQPQIDAFKDPQIQFLPFPDPLINYLLTASSLKVYQKLMKTCKYFYSRKRITVIPSVNVHYLKITTSYVVYNNPILKLHSNQISKIWITINLDSNFPDDQKSLSKFCIKIYECQARIINIYYQELTEAEFELLAQAEFVLCLIMEQTLITKRDGTFMGIVDVLKRVPNVMEFSFADPAITSQTFFKLSELQGKNKLMYFSYAPGINNFSDFQPNFNAKMFQIFVTKNAAPNARLELCFGYTMEELLEAEKEKMNHFVDSWTPQKEKPTIAMWIKDYF